MIVYGVLSNDVSNLVSKDGIPWCQQTENSFSAVAVVTSLRYNVVMRQNKYMKASVWCKILFLCFIKQNTLSKKRLERICWLLVAQCSLYPNWTKHFYCKGWVSSVPYQCYIVLRLIWPFTGMCFFIKEEQIWFTSRVTKGLDEWLIRLFFECGTIIWKRLLGCQPKQLSLLFD